MPDYRAPGGYAEEKETGTPPVAGRRTAPTGRREREKVPIRISPLTVSLAVNLIEGVTGGAPIEIPRISIEEIDAKPELKSDRFLLFLDVDLPEPPTPTVVFVDGGDRYREVTRKVLVIEQEDLGVPAEVEVYRPSNPTVPVWLFPEDATVFRGYVRDTEGNRMAEAELRIPKFGFGLAAETDANGRFVLYFKDTPADGNVEGELRHDRVENPVEVTLPVIEEEESVRTLVVDTDTETVTVHEGII